MGVLGGGVHYQRVLLPLLFRPKVFPTFPKPHDFKGGGGGATAAGPGSARPPRGAARTAPKLPITRGQGDEPGGGNRRSSYPFPNQRGAHTNPFPCPKKGAPPPRPNRGSGRCTQGYRNRDTPPLPQKKKKAPRSRDRAEIGWVPTYISP